MHAFYQVITIIIGFIGTDLGSMAQPQVVPKNLVVKVGTVSRFNCTAVQNDPVYWITRPYGSTTTFDIYIGEQFLVDDYGRSGRFVVEVNTTTRRYDLVIEDTMQKDGGVYICIDERGLGKKAYAELVVWGRPICQEDSLQENYMGENDLDLNTDVMHFSCRMNYSGNLRPRFEWSVGGKTFGGTRESESEIASSSLELVPKSMFNQARLTCEAVFQQDSDEVGRTGIIWISEPFRIHYAQWTNKAVKECQDVEWILDCNPPCSYELKSFGNGTRCCMMNYSTGNGFNVTSSCVYAVISSETTGISSGLIAAIILGVLGTIIGILAGCFCGKIYKTFKSRCITRTGNEPPNAIEMGRLDVNRTNESPNEGTAAERKPFVNAVPSTDETGFSTQSHSEREINYTTEDNSTMCTPAADQSNSENSSPTTSHSISMTYNPAANDLNSTSHSPARNDSISTSPTTTTAENESNSKAQNIIPSETVPAS